MKTGLVRWEWHALDHINVSDSETSPPNEQRVGLVPPQLDRSRVRRGHPHLGAQHVGRLPDPGRQRPDPLAPRRPRTARSRWGRARRRAWQHDGRVLPNGDVTLFDDGSDPPREPQSRACTIALDFETTPGAPGLSLHAPQPAAARREPGQRCRPWRAETRFVGFGGVPYVSEFAKDGSLLFDAHLPVRP